MKISNVIIHLLKKERHEESIIRFRERVLELKPAVIHLIEDIRDIYNNRTGKTYGNFTDNPHSYPFQQFLKEYFDNPGNFIDFSKKAIKHLKVVIDREGLATGGYILVVHYVEKTINYLMVLMLNDKLASSINPDTLDVQDIMHLNLEKLHFASRVNIKKWKAGEKNHVTFIKGIRRQGVDVSKYFIEFIGCTEITAPKDATNELIKTILAYCKNKDLSIDDTNDIKSKTYNYCREKQKLGKPVNLSKLSHYLNEDSPDDFFNFANSEQFNINSEFDTDNNALRRLKRYYFRSPNLSISFSNELLNKSILYDKDTGQLTIMDIPDALRDQLDEI